MNGTQEALMLTWRLITGGLPSKSIRESTTDYFWKEGINRVNNRLSFTVRSTLVGLMLMFKLICYGRQSKAITNFPETLPAPQSDLANQLLKDPYHLDFLAIGPDVTERQLEMALLERLKNFQTSDRCSRVQINQ